MFGGSIARVIQWGSALCGFIPDTVEGEDGQVIHMDEDYINHIKETRLALMLEKTVRVDLFSLRKTKTVFTNFAMRRLK